jgi:beta-N-acetylhexosaminidase
MILLRILYYSILFIALLTTSCAVDIENEEAESILKKMDLKEKVGQLIMVAIPGKKMNRKTEKIISEYLPGGIILFGHNLDTGSRVKKYINEMQSVSMKNSGIPLFVSIDQEGGRVKRLKNGVTQFPGNMAAGIYNRCEKTYEMAKILGLQLRDLGVNMNLSPVLDVNNNPDNPVINLRSFGSDPLLVSKQGSSYIRGLQSSLCIAVGKHFPGHGDTSKDSHRTLPVIRHSLERLRKLEFVPFVNAIVNGVECMMTAHISYPTVLKSSEPATLSKTFLTDILRNEMKFNGVVFTDDLEMKAISKKMKIGEAAVRSFKAGADIILISTFGKTIAEIYNTLFERIKSGEIEIKRVDESVKRIIDMKLRYKIMSFINRKIGPGRVFFTKSERRILENADTLNREISRGAVFYSGKETGIINGKNRKRIIISDSALLKKSIKARSGDIFLERRVLLTRNRSRSKEKGRISVLYHISRLNPDIKELKALRDYCWKNSLELVVLSSGNPFPVARSGLAKNMLISFSNTDESIKQLAACINGEFTPLMKSSLQLGMKR